MNRLVPVALLSLLAAGCMQSVEPDPYGDAQKAVDAAARSVLALDHDVEGGHHFGALHRGSHNMQLVGYSNGFDDSGDPDRIPSRGVYNEIALHGNHAFLSRSSADGSFGGFSVVDISDPAAPKVIGAFAAQGGSDIEVSADGTLAFLATQRNTVEQLAGGAQATQSPSGGLPRGILVVDVADRAHPALDSFVPLPTNGPHTLTYYLHPNGQEYLVGCTYDLLTDPGTGNIVGAAPGSQRVIVYLVTRNPSPGTVPGLPDVGLVAVAQYQRSGGSTGQLVFPHDTSVDVHAETGKVLITVSYWDLGVRILDFTAPPAPGPDSGLPSLPEVGAFSDFSPSAFNNVHFAKPFGAPLDAGNGTMVEVTVVEPEIIVAEHETGQITFLDTTDPSQPEKLSHWTLPAQDPALGVTDLDFSPHNFDTWDGKVALTHYHAGVWVIDVSTPDNLAHPKEVGFYMTSKPRSDSPAPQPDAWSVRARDGLLYVSDEASGLYILRYTGP